MSVLRMGKDGSKPLHEGGIMPAPGAVPYDPLITAASLP